MNKSIRIFIKVFQIVTVTLFCFIISCQQQESKSKYNEKELRVLAERVGEIWAGNLEVIDEICSPDYVRHEVNIYEDRNIDDYKDWIKFIRKAYPDHKSTIDEIIVKDDKTIIRWTHTGTNTGPRGDMGPTGKKINISGVFIAKWINGKIVEEWVYYNQEALSKQLGYNVAAPY